jgi:hypothetical protein
VSRLERISRQDGSLLIITLTAACFRDFHVAINLRKGAFAHCLALEQVKQAERSYSVMHALTFDIIPIYSTLNNITIH